MGFFSDLAELGRDIGSELSNLGKEISGITKDAVEEFKEDPVKYTSESVADIAKGTAKVVDFAVTTALPAVAASMAKTTMSRADQMLERNDLSGDQREEFERIRDNS